MLSTKGRLGRNFSSSVDRSGYFEIIRELFVCVFLSCFLVEYFWIYPLTIPHRSVIYFDHTHSPLSSFSPCFSTLPVGWELPAWTHMRGYLLQHRQITTVYATEEKWLPSLCNHQQPKAPELGVEPGKSLNPIHVGILIGFMLGSPCAGNQPRPLWVHDCYGTLGPEESPLQHSFPSSVLTAFPHTFLSLHCGKLDFDGPIYSQRSSQFWVSALSTALCTLKLFWPMSRTAQICGYKH